jgi:uncharacterized protein (DUF58 family)
MTRYAEPKLAAYLTVVAAGLLGAIALDLPELAATVAPFALFLLAGALFERAPALDAELALRPDRVLEGEDVTLELQLRAAAPIARLTVEVEVPAGLSAESEATVVSLGARPRRLALGIHAARWGGYALGPVRAITRDDFALHAYAGRLGRPVGLHVHPRAQRLRRGLRPYATRPQAGTLASRARGEGLEPGELRPFAPGDRVRRINWRATARRGRPYVSDRQLERNADVVLFLDTFVDAGSARDGTLAATVRAADALAAHHLARGDRVAAVGFGGVLSWLLPGAGRRQRNRIAATLVRSEVVFSYAAKDLKVLPAGLLPAGALVIAITPLLDDRAITAIIDLRARGFDVAALVISPFDFLPSPLGSTEALARRLWRLEHDDLRQRLQEAGIAVGVWADPLPLDAAVEAVNGFRRFATGGRV